MFFEIGKCYQHSGGQMFKILCKTESTLWGTTLVAETNDGTLQPVGWDSEDYATNWFEIPEEKWLKNFS